MTGKEFLRKSQFVLMIALGCYPATLCLMLFTMPQLLPYTWLFPTIYGITGMAALAFPGKARLTIGVLGVLLMTIPSFLWLEGTEKSIALVVAVIYGGLLLSSMGMARWEWDRELSAGWVICCFLSLLIGCFISFVEPKMEAYGTAIRISLFVFLFLALRSLNRGSLQWASGGRKSVSPSMQRKNMLMSVCLFVVAVTIALLPSAFELLKDLFVLLGRFFAWLKQLLASLKPEDLPEESTTEWTTVPETTGEGLGVLTEKIPRRESSAAEQAMMTTIVMAVLIPAGLFGLFKIIQLLIKGIGRLSGAIQQAMNAQSEDYQDEITDTRREDGEERAKKQRRKKRVMAKKDMTPVQRIRYHYCRLAKKHPEWQAHHTARENLPEEAALLYERARYSDHAVTQQEAEQFTQMTK